jgi:hypothetical protein
LKNPNSSLIQVIPKLLESAVTIINSENRKTFKIDCAGTCLEINAPSNEEFTEILTSAFFESSSPQSKLKLVIFKSSESDFLDILDQKDDEGRLLLREFADYEKYIAIDRAWNAIYFLDKVNKVGGVWAPSYKNVSLASFITPLRTLLSWCIDDEDLEIVHAAGVEIHDAGVLITGASGSGKSTLALFAALQGHGILGDDAIVVDQCEMTALYKNAKIENTSSLLDIEEKHLVNLSGPGITKSILPLVDNGFNFLPKTSLDVVVLPFIGNSSKYKRMSQIESIKEFMPQTTRELLGGTSKNYSSLMKIVKNVPFYKLELSPNSQENLEALTKIVLEA